MTVSTRIALIKTTTRPRLVKVIGPTCKIIYWCLCEATSIVKVSLEQLDAQDCKNGYEK